MGRVSRIRRTDSPFHDPVQSPRFIRLKCNWFFLSREQGMHGPYETEVGAETALEVFLADLAAARLSRQGHRAASTDNSPIPSYQAVPNYQVDEISADNILPWKKNKWTT